MGLVIPYDREGLDLKVAAQLDQVLASIQTWAGKQDGAGRFVDVPFNAGFFRSSVGAWTVDAGDYRIFKYAVQQELMDLRVAIIGSTTDAAVTNDLRILIPGGYRVADQYFMGTFQWNAETAAVDGVGRAFGMPGPTENNWLRLLRDTLATSTNWPASETNTFNMQLNLRIPVYRDPNT